MNPIKCFVLILYSLSIGMMVGYRGLLTLIPVGIGLLISITALIVKLTTDK